MSVGAMKTRSLVRAALSGALMFYGIAKIWSGWQDWFTTPAWAYYGIAAGELVLSVALYTRWVGVALGSVAVLFFAMACYGLFLVREHGTCGCLGTLV